MSFRSESRSRALRWIATVLASSSVAHAIGCGSGGAFGGDSDSSSSSSRFDTDELDAGISVSASTPGRISVGASLEYDSLFDVEPVELDGGDSFRATLDGRSRTLERSETSTDPAIDTSRDCSLELDFLRIAFATIAPPFSPGSDMQSTQRRSVQGMSITF